MPQYQRLHSGFLANASLYPNNCALSIGESNWTYSEIDESARRWAAAILNTCSGAPARIGILGSRSFVSYASTLACLYAGAAFVPLSPSAPLSRTLQMIRESELDALFIDTNAVQHLADIVEGTDIQCAIVPEVDSTDIESSRARILCRADLLLHTALQLPIEVSADSTAYVIFTSGSTGTPKGVPISHRNIVHFLSTCQSRYQLGPDDRLTQIFEQTFDPSVFDLFMAWWSGARACVMQPMELLSPFRFIQQHRITWWNSVPSLVALLLKKNLLLPNSLPTLRWSLFGGEPLTRNLAEAWHIAAPNAAIDNMYGPTETTVACASYRWNPTESPRECVGNAVPIGKVFDGLHDVVIDSERRIVPRGALGELCIAGPQNFSGYLNDPVKTSRSTVTLSVPGHGSQLFYRTGDKVKMLDSGDYIFVGRCDHQVKIQGYRIELAEIESVFINQAGVSQAAALGWPLIDAKPCGIVAFVSGTGIRTEDLLQAAQKFLPPYMMPRKIHIINSMPLNANGKIDRNSLYSFLSTDGGQMDGPATEVRHGAYVTM